MKKNSIKRFYFLVIAPFLHLSSCLNEDALEKVSHEHKHRFNQEIVSFSKVNYLEPQINSFYQARNQNLRTSSTDSLNLDLSWVLVIEDSQSNYKSYSIVINNSIPENSTYFFENYHIIEEDDIILDSFIFRWTSDNPQNDFNLKTFSGTVQKFDINYNLITQSFYINGVLQQQNNNGNKNIASNNDTFEYYMACDVVTTCPCQGTGSGYCSCDPTSGSYTDSCGMTVGIVCYLTGGGSGDGGSGDSGSGLGGEGGGGGSSNDGQNDDNIGDNGDPLHPVVPLELEPLEELEKTKPCLELNKLTSNSNIKNTFNGNDGLNTKINEPKEYGFAFKRTPYYDTFEVVPNDIKNPALLKMPFGGNIFGGSQTHPDKNLGYYPMFPGPDIKYLSQIASRFNWSSLSNHELDYSIFVLTLTTETGTYALKIEDWFKFSLFMSDVNKYKELEKNIYRRYSQIGHDEEKLIKALLKKIDENNLGIGLYKAEADFSNWNKLTLYDSKNENSILIKTPC